MFACVLYRFTLTEHDLDGPWIVRGEDIQTVTLGDDASFFAWVHEHWPPPRSPVELDPWQLAPQP
jgi:hypothetical protein